MGSATKGGQTQGQGLGQGSKGSNVWRKMLQPNGKWEDKDQFLDVLYWGRQVLAVLMGLVWGFFGLTGFLGIASFMAFNSIAVYLYSLNFNNDTEDMMEYVKEGFMTSFSAFMVTWTMMYSALFF